MTAHTSNDETIDRLAKLFVDHPAWVSAARHLSASATSSVYFSHQPGQAWRLEQHEGRTVLLAGKAPDPDFVFRFTPASVERLEAIEGGVGEFAVTLFTLILEDDERLHVSLRIVAGFARLVLRGYVKLLVATGPEVLAFGAKHGIITIGALSRFVGELRSRGPEEWERSDAD
jgi:hypothetical protein